MLKYIVFLGAVVNLLGAFLYIRSTLKGETKPNRVSRLMRAITPLIGSAAAFSDGVGWGAIPVFMSGIAPLLVFLASFLNRKSYRKLGKFDYVCGIFSALALLFWWITKDPAIAIFLAIISNFFSGIPTFIKSRKHPETESVSPYASGLFNALTSFFAMKTSGFIELAFPIYIVVSNLFLVIVLFRKKK